MKFDRYANAAEADSKHGFVAMPTSQANTTSTKTRLSEFVGSLEEFSRDPASVRAKYPWAPRFVMGLPLPVWQRDPKWSPQEQQAFIESIWQGVDLGSMMHNRAWEIADNQTGAFVKNSDVLLDGQQRLMAIEGYLLGEFAVPDVNGVPRKWGDLPRVERSRFLATTIPLVEVNTFDEQVLRQVYNLRNFTGRRHELSERATQADHGSILDLRYTAKLHLQSNGKIRTVDLLVSTDPTDVIGLRQANTELDNWCKRQPGLIRRDNPDMLFGGDWVNLSTGDVVQLDTCSAKYAPHQHIQDVDLEEIQASLDTESEMSDDDQPLASSPRP